MTRAMSRAVWPSTLTDFERYEEKASTASYCTQLKIVLSIETWNIHCPYADRKVWSFITFQWAVTINCMKQKDEHLVHKLQWGSPRARNFDVCKISFGVPTFALHRALSPLKPGQVLYRWSIELFFSAMTLEVRWILVAPLHIHAFNWVRG